MLDVDATHVSATWWRHIPAGGDVYHQPVDPADGRWQRGVEGEAWYLGDEPSTVWAEWYRAVAELGVPPMANLPRDLWEWEISLTRVADLSDAQRLARAGLPIPKPGRKDWPQFQDFGQQLRQEGYQGLLAPSAARPAHMVLCLFRVARDIPGARPLPPPVQVNEPPDVPTGMTT